MKSISKRSEFYRGIFLGVSGGVIVAISIAIFEFIEKIWGDSLDIFSLTMLKVMVIPAIASLILFIFFEGAKARDRYEKKK